MQTYLVHTRQPLRLWHEFGIWRLFCFHALFGGFLLSVLLYPLMLAFITVELMHPFPFHTIPGSWHHLALVVALVDLLAGIMAALVMALVGVRRAKLIGLAGDVAAAPIYWLLISIAGYRALLQLIWSPHLWEKTEHSARRRHHKR